MPQHTLRKRIGIKLYFWKHGIHRSRRRRGTTRVRIWSIEPMVVVRFARGSVPSATVTTTTTAATRVFCDRLSQGIPSCPVRILAGLLNAQRTIGRFTEFLVPRQGQKTRVRVHDPTTQDNVQDGKHPRTPTDPFVRGAFDGKTKTTNEQQIKTTPRQRKHETTTVLAATMATGQPQFGNDKNATEKRGVTG